MAIELVAEPGNKYDSCAIGVWVPAGLISNPMKLGYVQSELEADLSGKQLRGRILQVTGGGREKYYGVNIEIDTRAGVGSCGTVIVRGTLVALGLVIGFAAIGFLMRKTEQTKQAAAPEALPPAEARSPEAEPEAKEPTEEEKRALEASAMLRAARQLDSFGRIHAGVEGYRKVIKKFPESKEAEFARTRLKAMGEDSK